MAASVAKNAMRAAGVADDAEISIRSSREVHIVEESVLSDDEVDRAFREAVSDLARSDALTDKDDAHVIDVAHGNRVAAERGRRESERC
jgi:hypothetical protein